MDLLQVQHHHMNFQKPSTLYPQLREILFSNDTIPPVEKQASMVLY